MTRGGKWGHFLRRMVHVGMLGVPFLYFYYADTFSAYFDFRPQALVALLVLCVLGLDVLRLCCGFTFIGQRNFESHQLSSFAWGTVGIGFVLVLGKGPSLAIPIIAVCALVDPLMGEMRVRNYPRWLVALVGTMLAVALWVLAYFWFGTPWYWALILAPVAVGAEHLRIKWVDDNALMMLVPLLVFWLLQPLIP